MISKDVFDHFAGELIEEQHAIMRYNGCPLDGLTAPLKGQTASGVSGIHFPGSLFGYFLGMSVDESKKVYNLANLEIPFIPSAFPSPKERIQCSMSFNVT